MRLVGFDAGRAQRVGGHRCAHPIGQPRRVELRDGANPARAVRDAIPEQLAPHPERRDDADAGNDHARPGCRHGDSYNTSR
jgi:hypothetical protein